jgi:hypothetical protein
LVDSIPVPVCKIAREKQSKICKEDFETSPDKGYSAVSKSYYYGYKLHLVTSVRGVFHSMDITKASVHDVHYLSNVKISGLSSCTLIAVTLLQYINSKNDKPINHLKYALAS